MNLVVPIIFVHAFCGLFALGAGAVLFVQPKRTPLHKRLGHYYAATLVVVDVTSWLLYFIRGSTLNAFHVLALANLFALSWGIATAILRKPHGKWYRHHYYLISWSYVGLVAATLVEIALKVGQVTSVASIVALTVSPVLCGGLWIEWKSRRLGDTPSRPHKMKPLLAA